MNEIQKPKLDDKSRSEADEGSEDGSEMPDNLEIERTLVYMPIKGKSQVTQLLNICFKIKWLTNPTGKPTLQK